MVKACNKRLGEGPLKSCKFGCKSKEKPGSTSFSRGIIPVGIFSFGAHGTKVDTVSFKGENEGWPEPEIEAWLKSVHISWSFSRVNWTSASTIVQSLANCPIFRPMWSGQQINIGGQYILFPPPNSYNLEVYTPPLPTCMHHQNSQKYSQNRLFSPFCLIT